jgi:hypothetical protein
MPESEPATAPGSPGESTHSAVPALAGAPPRVWFWLLSATLSGAVLMSLELVAFRLYAPFFGNSVYVWGVMISVVMAGLAGGYAVGGRLADRMRGDRLLYAAVLASAAYQLLVLFLLPRLMPWLQLRGLAVGATLGTLLIFVVPMGSLAATGPMVIRLCVRSGRVGAAAGTVYALSTAGSIAGIIGTTFLLLPHIGTAATLKTLCTLSFALGLAGLLPRSGAAALLGLPLLAAGWAAPGIGWDRGTIWSAESPYNLVLVSRQGDSTILQLNQRNGFHTVHKDSSLWTDTNLDYYALGPLLGKADRALVLGMAGGASVGVTRVVAPQMPIDAVEIDPAVVQAASQWFGLNRADPNLHVYTADARPWLARSGERYGIVHVDLYQGGPFIPFYLTTEEFFAQVRAHLDPQGVMMMNVYDLSRRHRLLSALVATIRQVFPSVVAMQTYAPNYMVLAFAQPRSPAQVQAEILAAPAGRVADIAKRAADALFDPQPPAGTPVFTDDRAPVEEITMEMLHYR